MLATSFHQILDNVPFSPFGLRKKKDQFITKRCKFLSTPAFCWMRLTAGNLGYDLELASLFGRQE